jgi:hypothetical protein
LRKQEKAAYIKITHYGDSIMKFKQIFGGVVLGLMLGNTMAQTTVTPLARVVSQWTLTPGGSLRVYASQCESPGGYGSISVESVLSWSPLRYQIVLSNPTAAILTFSCVVNQS